MTPAPTPPSDGSPLPPRHRPNMGSLAKDTTERDLWDFDQPEVSEEGNVGEPEEKPREVESAIPAPRNPDKPVLPRKPGATTSKSPDGRNQDRIQVNLGRSRGKTEGSGTQAPASKAGHEFDELDNWDDPLPEIDSIESSQPVPAAILAVEPDEVAPPPAAPADMPDEVPSERPAGPDPDDTSDLPGKAPAASARNAIPLLLGPILGLSKIEKLGLILLSALLLFGAGAFFITSLKRLPTESARVEATDFPIAGEHLTVTSGETYWRAPILEGPSPDTFRRGTVLLPVLSLEASEGNAAIRVVFRNHDGEVIGDVVTRSVQGAQKHEIAATGGFDDAGMHAAYRTGESKPWTITVSEAASVNSPSDEFKLLFEMNVSTVRR